MSGTNGGGGGRRKVMNGKGKYVVYGLVTLACVPMIGPVIDAATNVGNTGASIVNKGNQVVNKVNGQLDKINVGG